MSEVENIKINKREYWEEQVKRWKKSNLNQSEFCRQANLKLSTFGYWLSVFSKPAKEIKNKFIPVKIIKPTRPTYPGKSIKIKLFTGHMVYLPIEMGIQEITKLIQSLGISHA